MKIQVKDLKKGDIFTECGITNEVVELTYDKYVNGVDVCTISARALKFNKKIFGNMKPPKDNDKFGYYTKKLTTSISVKR
ncbi:MAG: hypothetical protein GY891_00985 [Bacteroidetes bacterium]|nr:hypothetical protein [Bacteroidota bacterium]